MLFFDLPTITCENRRSYRKFIKYLKAEGFIQLQESVYTKLVLNHSAELLLMKRLKDMRPPSGLVQVLTVTEKQFASMTDITGSGKEHPEISSTDRLVII